MKKAFISVNAINSLISSPVDWIPLKPYDKLDLPVNSHADMLIFIIGRKIFCYEEYFEQNKSIFEGLEDYEIVKIAKKCGAKYPDDIALNALVLDKLIIASLKHTSSEILEYAKGAGYKLINVNQGYSACSTLVLNKDTIITADKGIYDAVIAEGKDALLISAGGILIDQYSYGFIGGASFVIDDTVYFFGDISKHQDYEKIKGKIDSLGMKISSIMLGNVFDFGGIRLL